MENTTTMSVKLPIKLKHQIELVARATNRSESFCVLEALRAYAEKEAWQIEAIRKGIISADEGRMADHSEVVRWVESWDTESEKEAPECV